MKPVTFGIIGAGRIGKLHADNLLSRVDGARLKAITDPFLDEDWAASRYIPLTGKDHRILLEDPEIDAIKQKINIHRQYDQNGSCRSTAVHSQTIRGNERR